MSILRSEIIQDVTTAGKKGWCQNDFYPKSGFFSAIQSGLALNAMPTPFARAEVVKQAFNAISDPTIQVSFDTVGFTYQQLVSDALDILEMLYEYELYKDVISINSCKISQIDFPKSNEVEDIGISRYHSFLKKSLEGFKMVDEVYFVVYNDGAKSYVLAMSAPETLFFTTSRLDRNNGATNEYDLYIPRKDNTGKEFFSKPLSLTERGQSFQDYLYNLYVCNKPILGETALGRYISKEFGNNRNNTFSADSTEPLKDEGKVDVVLSLGEGAVLKLYKNIRPQSAALIREKLVNVGFRINSDKFATIPYHDVNLLPLNIEALSKVADPDSLINNLSITHSYVKTKNNFGEEYGLMTDETRADDMIPFDLGIYPFFKYPSTYIIEGVNTYNVVLAYQYNGTLPDDAICLTFYRRTGGKIEKINTFSRVDYSKKELGIKIGVVRDVRTDFTSPEKRIRTIHYTLVGTQFDYIQVEFNLTDIKTSGVLKPLFTKPEENEDKIKFAVDFGTTSTYVASKKADKDPVILITREQSMVFLHGNPSEHNQSRVYKYELYNMNNNSTPNEIAIPELVKYIKNEFVPSSIDNEVYKFPLRTAMSYITSRKAELFANANIAFTYDREPAVGTNEFKTNIKWDLEHNNYSKLFIRQIIKICVLHAISEGCKKKNIEFLYFYPLAMNEDTYNEIKDAWVEGCKEFGLPDDCATCMTESLAPYYAAPKDDASCVVSIDIGGGSVDTVVYKDRKAKYAFSALFGCDVLWSGGKNMASNDKSNPIFNQLKPDMESVDGNSELKAIQTGMLKPDSNFSSTEIMNFWLSNDSFYNVTKKLKTTKYKPVYVGHFYSVLYHIAQTMKVKKMDVPTEITLSGNGSTYLNYIEKSLSDIAVTAFRDVYGVCDTRIKITLPKDLKFKGKEMTAIGGLKYNPADEDSVILDNKNFIYMGERLEKYESVTAENKDAVMKENAMVEDMVQSICENVFTMQSGLQNLLNQLNIDVGDFSSTMNEFRTTLKDIVEDHKHGKYYVGAKKIESTLFFVPIRQMIFKLEQAVR